MAFDEVQFPLGIAFGSSGGPERRTDIVTLGSGYEERNSPWADSRRRYDAGYGVRSLEDLHTVIAFFEARLGRLHGFRWKDRADHKSGPYGAPVTPTDELLGTGDGTSSSFTLKKHYASGGSSYTRSITKPIDDTVRVAVDGVEQTPASDFVLDTTDGQVTFLPGREPASGVSVTAGFEFDVPVRFDTDFLDISLSGFDAGDIPSIPLVEIRAHLDSGATTLCQCWKLIRRDGTVMGFTDHDRDLSFNGTLFEAAAGFTASALESSAGLAVDNLDVLGALSSDYLEDGDLAAGLYDDAEIEIWRVNWQEPDQRVLMRKGNLGEISRGPTGFTAEVRGLTHRLNQPTGRLYQYACDADLGDTRCGIALSDSAFTGAGSVVSVSDNREMTIAGLDAYADTWFSRGLLTFTSGANQSEVLEVKRHAKSAGAVVLEVWHAPAQAIEVGANLSVSAGCDKQFGTCRTKFANAVQFRGFPHIPGNDFALSYPASRFGVGADCLGLIRGVYRDLYAREPEAPPPYSPDWAEIPDLEGLRDEPMAEAARRHLRELEFEAARPGDVLLFRMTPMAAAKHAAIKSTHGKLVATAPGLRVPLSRRDCLVASVLLSAAGSAAGSALLPSGASFLGAHVSGTAIGEAFGTIAGSLIDDQLFGTSITRDGPRLSDLDVQVSTEGAAIPRVYGRVRLAGQVIWSTKFKETASTNSGGSGKGSGGGSAASTTSYTYSVSCAIALCEGPITRIGSIWADGNLLDLTGLSYRTYLGTETQQPYSTMEAVEGAGNVPAYRGLAYIVFDDLQLADFGNRLPQLTFEVFHALSDIEQDIKAVTIIPGATEFGYDTQAVRRIFADGVSDPENTNNRIGGTDWQVSLDDLQATCPNLTAAALVVSWYGDDLRAGSCTLRPKVDRQDKVTVPEDWQVAGLDRGSALPVSQVEGRPAFGGTPSDASVKRAIEDLKSRGLSVCFYPFILMDVPAGNGLADPYGDVEQAAYPWRGRISIDPAPGFVGSPDKTAAVATEVAAFFGTASASDFAITTSGVTYSGPDEWTYRRMILHQAALCVWAGGVESFLIGTEMRGLTQLRDSATTYPAVTELVALAAEVRTLLGPSTKISYAADWSEYFGHHPEDGTGDVFFHLDPLWADANIDFIGIDNYMPLADWRDGLSHLDAAAGATSIYDLNYLTGNIAGGEGYDWFYASTSDRNNQIRTLITDGAHGKPWVFRYKDLKSWWSNPHYDRPGGVEAASATGWVPMSKPLRFTELGCPAIDKGANQPNVFVDPKSSESTPPFYSSGQRDDYVQRRFLEAHLINWQDAGANPVSPVYGGRMVDTDHLYVWTWDARPYPSFPSLTSVWSDGDNWKLGHWITGRLGAVPLALLVPEIAKAGGTLPLDAGSLTGTVDGFVIDRILSPRQALEPLMLAHFFDAAESEGIIRFQHAGNAPSVTVTPDQLAVEQTSAQGGFTLTRGQETELPFTAKLTYLDAQSDYRQAAVEARRATVSSERVSTAALPMVLTQTNAQRIAEIWLQDTWVKRERASLSLPPSLLALDPGDVVTLDLENRQADYRLTGLSDEGAIHADAVKTDARVFGLLAAPDRERPAATVPSFGAPDVAFLDLPLMSSEQVPHAPFMAATAAPWPGGVALYRSTTGSGFALDRVFDAPATMGRTTTDLVAGPVSRWDRANAVELRLAHGALQSQPEQAVLNGANLAALETAPGRWEVFQFAQADLVDVNTYRLADLLRGLGGTETAMAANLVAGARFVLLDQAVQQIGLSSEERGLDIHWRYGPSRYEIGHETYATEVRAFDGVGLKPFSPVHIRGERGETGGIALTWVRRTRLGGDSWVGLDVPLNEEVEAYEIDVVDGTSVKRTLAASTTLAIYSSADQIADFGSDDFPTLTLRAQKHVTVNDALNRLDALVHLSVDSATETTPPGSPAEGGRWIVASGATGAWAGQDRKVAAWIDGAWVFLEPQSGWQVWVASTRTWLVYDGTDWRTGPAASVAALSTHDAATRIETVELDHSIVAGAFNDTGLSIPDRSIVFGVTGRVLTDVTGPTSWTLGVAADPGRYGTSIGLTAGSTVNGVSGTPTAYYGVTPVRITSTGSDFTGGAVRLALHYVILDIPAS
eukprot:s1_g686.t1